MSFVCVRCAVFPLLCRAGPGCFCVVVCLPVQCFVVRFVAVLLLFVALSPVLARCPSVWRWRTLWRFFWCVVLFPLVLCLVARLMRCCGVLCWPACFVSSCVVFCCLLVAGWCLVLMPVFWGPVVGPVAPCRLLVVRVVRRPFTRRLGVVPCGVLFPDAVSWGAVLPCGAVLLGFSVLLSLLLVFGFALYCKNHCKIQNKTTFPLFFKRRLDTTQHAHVGRKQNLCNSGLTYMLPAVLNGIVVVDVKFARG